MTTNNWSEILNSLQDIKINPIHVCTFISHINVLLYGSCRLWKGRCVDFNPFSQILGVWHPFSSRFTELDQSHHWLPIVHQKLILHNPRPKQEDALHALACPQDRTSTPVGDFLMDPFHYYPIVFVRHSLQVMSSTFPLQLWVVPEHLLASHALLPLAVVVSTACRSWSPMVIVVARYPLSASCWNY